MSAAILLKLVRSPADLLDGSLAELAPRLLSMTALGAMAFGAAVGMQHSATQSFSSAIKLPFILLVPPIVAMPVLAALAHAFGLRLGGERAALAAMACVARIAVFAAGLAPVFWLAVTVFGGYRWTVGCAVLALATSGLLGLNVLWHAPAPSEKSTFGRAIVVLGTVVVFGTIAAQTGWLLRPLVLHPHLDFVWLEHPESDVFTELLRRGGGARPHRPPRDARSENLRSAPSVYPL